MEQSLANYRIPGPLGSERLRWSIDDRTLARCVMPPPGTIGGMSCLYPATELSSSLAGTSEPDLGFLFLQSLSPVTGLTDADDIKAVTSLSSSSRPRRQHSGRRARSSRSYVETRVTAALATGKHGERKQKIDELMEVFGRLGERSLS